MLVLPKTIKMVVTDFDGVITDNCVYINEAGQMSRKLNFKDILAFSLLKKNGFKTAIISGEANSAIDIIAKKFDIIDIHRNIRNKYEVLQTIINKLLINSLVSTAIVPTSTGCPCLCLLSISFTIALYVPCLF